MNKNLLHAAALSMAIGNFSGAVEMEPPKPRKRATKDRSKVKAARKQSRKNRKHK